MNIKKFVVSCIITILALLLYNSTYAQSLSATNTRGTYRIIKGFTPDDVSIYSYTRITIIPNLIYIYNVNGDRYEFVIARTILHESGVLLFFDPTYKLCIGMMKNDNNSYRFFLSKYDPGYNDYMIYVNFIAIKN